MEEGQMGFGAHNDSGFLTIVHTRTVGLQVDPTGRDEWVDVPVVPVSFNLQNDDSSIENDDSSIEKW